jgi:hypothetical protein
MDRKFIFRGASDDREAWREAFDKLVIRVRCCDVIPIMLNDVKVETEAEFHGDEVRLSYRATAENSEPVSHLAVVIDRKTVVGNPVNAFTLGKNDKLELILLELPSGILRAAVTSKGYRGNPKIAQFL